MRRLPGWEQALAAYDESRRVEPFEYGSNDCASFVRGALVAMTGQDPCPGLTWNDEASAERLAAELEAVVTRYLGGPVAAQLVKRGGVLLLDNGRGLALKVGARACLPGEFTDHVLEEQKVYRIKREGLVFLPLSRFTKGWNVG